jgi:GcrA cell cycle regulator
MARQTTWADPDLSERLLRLTDAGLSTKQAAVELGLTYSSAKNRLYALRRSIVASFNPSRWTQEDERQLVSLHVKGRTLPQMSDFLNRSHNSVYKKLRSMGLLNNGDPRREIEYKASPWTKETKVLVAELFEEGLTATEIGKRVGLTKNSVIGWLDRNGLKRKANDELIYTPTPNPFPPAGHCLYGMGHPGEPGFRFCGEVNARGRSYCEGHAAQIFRNPDKDKLEMVAA